MLDEYLDEFQVRVSGSTGNKTLLVHSIAPIITKERMLPQLVHLGEHVESFMARTKLAYLVGAYLAIQGAEEQFLNVVNSYGNI